MNPWIQKPRCIWCEPNGMNINKCLAFIFGLQNQTFKLMMLRWLFLYIYFFSVMFILCFIIIRMKSSTVKNRWQRNMSKSVFFFPVISPFSFWNSNKKEMHEICIFGQNMTFKCIRQLHPSTVLHTDDIFIFFHIIFVFACYHFDCLPHLLESIKIYKSRQSVSFVGIIWASEFFVSPLTMHTLLKNIILVE